MTLAFARWWMAAVILVAGAARVPGAARTLAHTRLAGHDYVHLSDWAQANGFEVHWLKRDESLQLSRGTSRAILTLDSRETRINGVEVWLSFAPAMLDGAVCLALLDAETTLRPLFFPQKRRPGLKLKTICLDPGHGGKDPGFCVGSSQEKKYTLLLAQELRQQLARAGFRVNLTRSTDRFIELPERPDLARQRDADLLISLHFNATESSRETVQGAQVFCMTPAGASSTNTGGEGGGAGAHPGNRCNANNILLAYQIQKSLLHGVAVVDRGVRRARFWVLRDATMPAVLIEAGFMSHPVEGRKILSAGYRRQLAQAIVAGLVAYQRAVEQ